MQQSLLSGRVLRGIVEDNNSPNKDGRLRVRIDGIHPPKDSTGFEQVPKEALPWLEVIQMNTFGLSDEIGASGVLAIDQWVYVDINDDLEQSKVIGIMASGHKDINPIAKGEYEETPKIPDDNPLGINEPNGLNDKSKYTDTRTIQSKSGHVITLDDTEDNERIRLEHKSGSSVEFRPDGSVVYKSVAGTTNYIINEGNLQNLIHGTVSTMIKGAVTAHVSGIVKSTLDSSLESIVQGAVKSTINDSLTSLIKGSVKSEVQSSVKSVIGGLLEISADNVVINSDVKINGSMKVSDSLKASGKIESSTDVRVMHVSLLTHKHGNSKPFTTPPV